MELGLEEFKEVKELVTQHDKAIDKMAMGIEHLAQEVGSTNRNLSEIIDVIGKQNILMEKFTNLDNAMKENFHTVHDKIRSLEATHVGSGCTAMKIATKADEDTTKRLTSLESSLTWIVRLIIGGLVSGALGTLTILVKGH